MDKRIEENKRVKTEIAKAYFGLLRQKHIDEISVVEITNKAKVSRMAYYRNFKSKIDIIDYYLDEVIWQEIESATKDDIQFWSGEYGISFLTAMKKHRSLLLLLDECGYTSRVLNTFNRKNEELAGDMPRNSIERYKLYYAAGASFNGVMEWIRGGCKESVEEFATHMLCFFNRPNE